MRRMFWLSVGAVLGVTGYRRVTALARSVRPEPQRNTLTGFAADVREGMAIYMDRQAGRAPAALDAPPTRGPGRGSSRNDDLKDGR
jgi:hypothetical protein